MKYFLGYFILALTVSCGSQTENKKGEQMQIPTTVELPTYQDLNGNEIDLDNFKGKRIFLNFWATWCKPCIKEMPDIEKASKILQKEDYVFLLASDESTEKIKKFVAKSDLNLEFIKFNGNYETMNIQALPTTMVFDREGKKTRHMTGSYDWASEKVLKNLRSVP